MDARFPLRVEFNFVENFRSQVYVEVRKVHLNEKFHYFFCYLLLLL